MLLVSVYSESLLLTQPRIITDLFFVSSNVLFLDISYKQKHANVVACIWLLSLSTSTFFW